MSKPIHTVSGKPQCQEPFTSHAGNQERCTRPERHDGICATAFASEPKRYPAQVSVYCDFCGHTHSGDYLVRDSDDQATRFGYARAHLSREGWSCDERGDFCPCCLPI